MIDVDKDPHRIGDDPVNGFSVIFSMRHPKKQAGKIKNTLKAHIARERVKKSSLNPRRIFFVENYNVHSLPQHCTGVLVAYSTVGKKISSDRDIINHHQWFLGIIIYHGYEKSYVAPIEIDMSYFQTSQNSSYEKDIEYHIMIEDALVLEKGNFQLRYVNVVKPTTEGYPYVQASLQGPDTVPRTAAMKELIQELKRSTVCLLPNGNCQVPSNYVGKSPLLDILHGYKDGRAMMTQRNKVKRRSMAEAGTHVVEIEGPITKLKEGVHEKCLIVPIVHRNDELYAKHDKHIQQYVYLPKDTYASFPRKGSRLTSTVNQELLSLSEKTVNVRKFDLHHFPKGLIFVFRSNPNLDQPTIVLEWDTTEPMEHWHFNGTVMSHWISSPRTYSLSQIHVDVMEQVYGHKGFNRSSVDSIGINIYTGIKSSPRAVASPVIPKDEVVISQLWNGKCDITYSPIANKIFNLLTTQAGGVMTACNALLDRFIHVVLARLYPKIQSDDRSSHRRYCSLSIFTAGCRKMLCDGFANTPHTDKKDVFQHNFQKEARNLLNELREMFHNDDTVLKELQYLERFTMFPSGFCVPTTCGYSILDTDEDDNLSSGSVINVTDFAMIGLGVSVTIRPKSYHYFMASLFTHCTPVPIQLQRTGHVSFFTGRHNVIGWGGGKAETDQTYKKRKRNSRKRKRS